MSNTTTSDLGLEIFNFASLRFSSLVPIPGFPQSNSNSVPDYCLRLNEKVNKDKVSNDVVLIGDGVDKLLLVVATTKKL